MRVLIVAGPLSCERRPAVRAGLLGDAIVDALSRV
jgi:hypothetical protein